MDVFREDQATPAARGLPASGDGQLRTARHEQGSTRHELLVALRRHGPASPDSLAHLLGVSRTAVLQQLRVLAASGLVQRQAVRHGVGRPRHLYDVTTDARTHFPSNYDQLATAVLQAIQAAGGASLVAHVLDELSAAQAAVIRARFAAEQLVAAPLVERVRELAVIQDEQGYLCEVLDSEMPAPEPGAPRSGAEAPGDPTGVRVPATRTAADAGPGESAVSPDGSLRLREHNCPLFRVADAVPVVCEAEMKLFRDVLGAEVERETHILAGARCCTYRIGGAAPANGAAG